MRPHIIGNKVIHLPDWIHLDLWSIGCYLLGCAFFFGIFIKIFL